MDQELDKWSHQFITDDQNIVTGDYVVDTISSPHFFFILILWCKNWDKKWAQISIYFFCWYLSLTFQKQQLQFSQVNLHILLWKPFLKYFIWCCIIVYFNFVSFINENKIKHLWKHQWYYDDSLEWLFTYQHKGYE